MPASPNDPTDEATPANMRVAGCTACLAYRAANRQLAARLRVALVDSDRRIHELVEQAFSDHSDGWSLERYRSPASLLAARARRPVACAPAGNEPLSTEGCCPSHAPPRVILTEVHFSGKADNGWVRRASAALPGARVLILTVSSDRHAILRRINAGALGYLVKPVPARCLVCAVNEVAHGRPVLSSQAQAALVDYARRTAGTGLAKVLSGRELETLLLLRNGATYQEIAAELGLSAGTIHRHLHDAYKKLGARGRAEALRRFSGGGG